MKTRNAPTHHLRLRFAPTIRPPTHTGFFQAPTGISFIAEPDAIGEHEGTRHNSWKLWTDSESACAGWDFDATKAAKTQLTM